jgi:carbonic anhydrase
VKKLIEGIVDFRKNTRVEYRNQFGRLAIGQCPDTLFVACSDSRVVPNTFASTNPGDLFVVRNVGNLVPPHDCCSHAGAQGTVGAEGAAIEFAVSQLGVSNIIVCGHSECGAMEALLNGRQRLASPHLREWLRHGDQALDQLKEGMVLDGKLTRKNQLSQINVLVQLERIRAYSVVAEKIKKGSLSLHAWWFDLAQADVHAFSDENRKFQLIDEDSAKGLLKELEERRA